VAYKKVRYKPEISGIPQKSEIKPLISGIQKGKIQTNNSWHTKKRDKNQ